MATLSGQKVKDKFGNLLQIDNGLTDASSRVVEDGSGVDSALKLGTGEVEVNGTLKFSSAPSEDTSELTQLMLNSSNVVVRQEKSANSIGDIDSGWKALPLNTNNSGTFTGVNYATATSATNVNSGLAFRIVGRQVFLKGQCYIPLDIGSGDRATTKAQNQASTATAVYTSSGMVTGSARRLVFPTLFDNDSSAVASSGLQEQVLQRWTPFWRQITVGGEFFTYNTFATVAITTDGKLEVRPFPDYDNAIVDGTADTHQTYSWAELQMKLDTNDTMHLVDYDAYKNGRISSGAGADQRIVTNTGQDSPFAFDGRVGTGNQLTQWGGLQFSLDGMSFLLGDTVTATQINSIISGNP